MVDRLSERANLSQVQVEYSWPGRNTDNESIWTTIPLDSDSSIPVMKADRKKRDESYRFDVICQVVKPGGTIKDANDRAQELLAEVDGALADDPKLGTTVVLWCQLQGFDLFEGRTDAGAGTRIEAHIDVRARLT